MNAKKPGEYGGEVFGSGSWESVREAVLILLYVFRHELVLIDAWTLKEIVQLKQSERRRVLLCAKRVMLEQARSARGG